MVGWDWQDAGGLVMLMCVLFAVGAVYCVVVVALVVAQPAADVRFRPNDLIDVRAKCGGRRMSATLAGSAPRFLFAKPTELCSTLP